MDEVTKTRLMWYALGRIAADVNSTYNHGRYARKILRIIKEEAPYVDENERGEGGESGSGTLL